MIDTETVATAKINRLTQAHYWFFALTIGLICGVYVVVYLAFFPLLFSFLGTTITGLLAFLTYPTFRAVPIPLWITGSLTLATNVIAVNTNLRLSVISPYYQYALGYVGLLILMTLIVALLRRHWVGLVYTLVIVVSLLLIPLGLLIADPAPLIEAFKRGHLGYARLLLAAGVSPDARSGRYSAMEEVYFRGGRINKLESIRMLLDAGADPNTEVSFRGTQEPLLLETVRRRQNDLVALLLDYGADPNRQRREDGLTALLVASSARNMSLVRLLAARGAEVNRPNKAGQTPLFVARTPEIALYLIERGASLGAQDELGRTALFPQAEQANVDNVRLLLEKGLEVNHRDATGRTPLFAAVTGHSDVERVEPVVRVLLEHGADPTVVNDDGLRAPDLAAREGKHTIVTLLSEATAR